MALKGGHARWRWAWTWAAIVFSAFAIASITWIHASQRFAIERTYAALSSLRLARIDLAKGLLYVMSSGEAPLFDKEQGLALIRQAAETFQEALRAGEAAFSGTPAIEPGNRAAIEEIRSAFGELAGRLAAAGPADLARPEFHAGLRIPFYDLERRTEHVDTDIQGELRSFLSRRDAEYLGALWFASIVLLGICAAVYAGARAETRADQALRDSQELLRSIIDNTPSLVYIFDLEGCCLLTNRNHAALFGWAAQDMIGRERSAWMPRETERSHRANDLRVAATGESATLEESIPGADGDRVYLTTKFPLLGPEGRVRAVGGISTEITARKRDEELLKTALADREILLREINHRTKNNMQVISSWLALQSGRSADPAVRAVLGEADARIQAMALVHRKLYRSGDLSRIDLADYIRDLLRLLLESHAATADRIETVLELEEVYVQIEIAVPCGLILSELVSNAMKHAFPGGRRGTIRVSLHRNEARELELLFADDGTGVPDGFDFQGRDGLGLKTLFAIGESQLRGRVAFEAGAGLTFRLAFSDAHYQPRV